MSPRLRAANLATLLPALLTACASLRPGDLDIVAESPDRQWTGVAVSQAGRIFVNYPNWGGPYTNAVEELLPTGERVPYPDARWNGWTPGADPAERFVCVQSVHIDNADRLWILDPAAPGFQGPVAGGPKLIEVDLATDEAARIYHFDSAVAPPGSYLNDVRIDLDANAAYITDSGRGAIVVLDLATGDARRLLEDHPAVKADPDLVPVIDGEPLTLGADPDGPTPRIHSDGLALDREYGFLYFQALTARTLHRVPTSALLDASLPARLLAERVEYLGATVVTDGMEIDEAGAIYFSALERDAVVYRTRDGRLFTLVRDARIAWPDSFAIGPNRTLYFTTSQIHRTPSFTGADAWPDTPYLLLRTRLPR
ncbi:MAG: L-dopachrome tautomerase-related protein [Phycisphaerales bacterium]